MSYMAACVLFFFLFRLYPVSAGEAILPPRVRNEISHSCCRPWNVRQPVPCRLFSLSRNKLVNLTLGLLNHLVDTGIAQSLKELVSHIVHVNHTA